MSEIVAAAPDTRRRVLALVSLVTGALAVAAAVFFVLGDLVQVLVASVALVVAVTAVWYTVTSRGWRRTVAVVVLVGAGLSIAGVLFFTQYRGVLVMRDPSEAATLAVIVGLTAVAISAAARALAPASTALPARESSEAARLEHPVVIMNPWSGGGKVGRFGLVEEASARGIEPVVLERGDDVRELARTAIDAGADGLGVAGGDGTQAIVADLAARHGVPYVCIPAGTRNHFALDLGLDRDDVVGALDAFGDAVEVRVDLAEVNGRTFVNNASLGLYAKIVQSEQYRDAKVQTAADLLPELLGPDSEPFDLRFTDGRGVDHASAHVILVSNNDYALETPTGFATRDRLDDGRLGVFALSINTAAELRSFVAAQATGRQASYRGVEKWTTERFVVESDAPVEVGVDGEAMVLDPPLEFTLRPAALRVRLPAGVATQSRRRAHVPPTVETIRRLWALAAGDR